MFESIQVLLDEHADLQNQLADPAVQANQGKARRVGRRYAELTGIVTAYNKYTSLKDDLEAAREMADEDPDFAAEIPGLEEELEVAQEKLRRLLIPRDPDDGRNVILEVKAGAGGDEENGPTSAWYVFSALGFYPVCPGSTQYMIGTPYFRKVKIQLENGKTVTICADKSDADNRFILRMAINGQPYPHYYLEHETLLSGSDIYFTMGSKPER